MEIIPSFSPDHGYRIFIGSLPPEWRGMVSMQTMNLNSNKLNGKSFTVIPRYADIFDEFIIHLGTLLSSWGSLTKLSSLDLGSNSLTGMW
jgi:hypothetical protein